MTMYRSYQKNRGFTLIELLVVIAIIGVLASVVLVSLNAGRIKGRDANRASQAQEIVKALELYYSDNGGYPSSSGFGNWTIELNTGSIQTAIVGGGYISQLPEDPAYEYGVDNNSYAYCSANATTYVLYVNVESDGVSDETGRCYITRGPTLGSCAGGSELGFFGQTGPCADVF